VVDSFGVLLTVLVSDGFLRALVARSASGVFFDFR
jgi:hypothetical protein